MFVCKELHHPGCMGISHEWRLNFTGTKQLRWFSEGFFRPQMTSSNHYCITNYKLEGLPQTLFCPDGFPKSLSGNSSLLVSGAQTWMGKNILLPNWIRKWKFMYKYVQVAYQRIFMIFANARLDHWGDFGCENWSRPQTCLVSGKRSSCRPKQSAVSTNHHIVSE